MFIRNTFHGTEYKTNRTSAEICRIIGMEPSMRTRDERAWVNRVRATLCGIAGCTCGGELDERGPQMWEEN